MKKWLKTGKKALSVIMAVLMVMTAWVWVAPTEASAATAGNYKVRITWQVNNTKNYSNSFTGTETEDGARAGIILYYKSNNGSGTQSSMYWCLDSTNYGGTYVSAEKSTGNTNSSTGKDYYCVATIAGFPTALYGMADSNNITDKGQYTVSKIEVYNNTKSAYDTLWAGKGYTDTSTEKKWWKITADGDGTVTTTGNDNKYGYASTTTETWNFPTPTTATKWSGVSAMTIPKTGTATQDIELVCNDQYGVEMFNPTWSVKGSVCGTTGISVDPTTSSQTTTIKLTNSANVSSATDTQTGTITATWSTLGSLSETFTITDTKYDVNFSYDTVESRTNGAGTFTFVKDGVKTTVENDVFHGDSVTNIPSPPSYYDDNSYYHTFKGWSIDGGINFLSSSQIPVATVDKTYTAYYNSVYKPADYTDLDKAIADGKTIQNDAEYTSKYTAASRKILNQALTAFPDDYKTVYGIVSQDVIDKFAKDINDAIADLDLNVFDVIFLDKDGAILLYEKDVEYKESVTAPSYSDKYYDSTNHYTFIGWETDEYSSVVDDLVIQPVFTAEAHTFTTETVPSTCVQKGATKYICSCGYSYIDGETDYGDHVWATEFTTDLEPTCTVAGSKSIHCTLCDAQKDITVIDPLGHQWNSQSVAVEASCGKIGIMTKVCDDCGVCEHTIIPALEHDYAENTVAPTCTTKGYTEYTCQRADCGHSYRDNYTDVIAHTYGAWETVSEARCEVPGVKKQTCTECGHVNIGSIDALTHDELDSLTWNVIVEDTCEYAGYRTKTCSKCNNVIASEVTNALTHNYVEKTVVAPTCTSKGYTVEECNRENCGVQRIVNETAALNHAWTSTTHEADCTHSAYIEHVCANDSAHNYVEYVSGSTALTHDFTGTETIISAATCVTDGKKTVKCSRCDATTEVIIPKTGHSYGDWVKTDATNDTDGSWYHKCSACGKEETLTIPKGGHNLVEDKTQYVAPKCNTKGKQVYKCINHENCTVTVTVELDYVQHTVAQRTSKVASCTTTGEVEAYCSVCNKSFSKTETPATAHNPVAGTAVAPTCTTSGYTPYACACGTFSYNVYDAANPATGHNFDETIAANVTTTAATCTADGSKTVKCSNCNEKSITVIPALGHDYKVDAAKSTTADCTTAGTEFYGCSRCDAEYIKFIEAAKGHKFDGEWTTVREATDSEPGVEKTICTVADCNAEQFRTTAPIGDHEYDVETVDPTCTTPGSKTYTCNKHTDCGAGYEEILPATGHTETISYTAPTCIATGSSKIICSVCGGEIAGTEIPVIYHDFSGEGVKVDATCTADGTITYTCKTKDCTVTKTETVPAKGHDLETTVNDAKCGEKGSVITSCSACTYSKTTELAAKGHIWGDTPTATKAATCEEDGSKTYKCQNCDKTNVVVIPKLGHDWNNWVVTPSTNDAPGSVSRTCSRGCTDSVEIPAGGHNLVEDTAQYVEPECDAKGQRVYKCTAHTDCTITVTVELDFAQHTVAQKEIEATCTTKGSVVAYCSACDVVLNTEEIPVKAHNHVAGEAVAPTCTTSGYTPYTCSCGDTYNVYDATKHATGHTLVEGASTATCTAGGEMTLTCSVCNKYTEIVTVPALGHYYVEDTAAATDATCAAPATKTYKCSRCTDSYTVPVGDKTENHTWGAWVVKENATNSSLGYQTATCEVCGQIKVETIPATGEHNFNVETERTLATCTADGSVTYKCSTHKDCGLTSTVVLPKLGHTEELVYTAATCTATGSAKRVCTVESCKAVIEEKEIPALGHLYGDGVVTPSTCNTKGSIEYTCTRTGCTNSKTVEIAINANAHQYATVVIDATCTAEGSVITECSLCHNVITNQSLGIKNHIFNSTETVINKATCTADGEKTVKCANCDAVDTVAIPATGHAWSDWTVTPSTNDGLGSVTRTCACGVSETVNIPAGGHSLVVDTDKSKPASCSAEGETVYKCENHDNCGITLTVTTEKLQHELETTKTDATCEVKGEVVTKCKNCSTTIITTEIPATGHTYDNGAETPATCTSAGKIVYTCTAKDCGKTKEVDLPKLQHNYIAGAPVEATCISSGYTPYKCDKCDSNYVIIKDSAKGHSYTKKVSSTADCTHEGVMVLECACGATMETAVPALGHNYAVESTTSATCALPATKTYKCSCGASYTVFEGEKTSSHTWGEVTNVPATNTSLGYETKTCSVCGQVSLEIFPATGEHKFDKLISEKAPTCEETGKKVYSCSAHTNCGLTSTVTVPANGHSEKLEYKAATCDEEGYTKIVCEVENCNYEKDVTTIEKLGHAWTMGEVTPATCKAKGNIKYTCARCNNATESVEIPVNPDAHKLKITTDPATCSKAGSVTVTCENSCDYNETTPLPKLEHTWGLWTVKKEPTNTEKGTMTRTCSSGSCTETVEIPAGGHAFGSTPDSTVAASCTGTGSETYKCTAHTDCGVEIIVTLAMTAHTPETTIVDASCTKEGSIKTICKDCNEPLAKDIILGKLQHVFIKQSETVATCTSSGYITYKCDNCAETYDEIVKGAVGHKLVVTPVGSTCTAAGNVIITCENCDMKQETGVPALGHDYQKIASTTASCAAAATETYKCSRCDATYTVSVGEKATDHKYPDTWTTVVEATETSIGYKTRECTVCHKLEVQTIDAKGEHKFENGDIVKTVNATCTENGYVERKCSVHTDCGKTAEITIFATGHDEVVATTAATCEVEGKVTTTCNNCDYKAEETIPALGHNYGEGTVTPSTCKDVGNVKYTCSRCNGEKVVAIPVNDKAHQYVTTVTPSTCTTEGKVVTKCSACDEYKEESLPKLEHSWNDGEEKPAATCTTDGTKLYSCTNDGCTATKTEKIAKLGHNMKAGTAVAPNCTTSGYTPYTCENGCGHSYNVYDASATANGHTYVQVEGTSTATCVDAGEVTLRCACGAEMKTAVPAKGHSFGEWTTTKNPTADEEGIKERKCNNCTVTETVTLPKLGHNMVKDEDASTAPTCTAGGKDVYVCDTHKGAEACGYTYSVDVAATGHSYGEAIETSAATCVTDGEKTRTCSCGATITEVIPKTGHTLTTTKTESTCKVAGSVVTECTKCDYEIVKTLDLKPHTISLSYKYPACEAEGYIKESCDVCDYENIVSETAALGHSFTGTETEVTPATCLTKGEKTVKCSRCDATTTVDIPAKGHDYAEGKAVDATCTESGYIPYKCNNCDSTYNKFVSNPNGHTWKTEAEDGEIKATCETDGVATYKCENCDATKEVITPKFGHSWTQWIISKNPTATEDGEKSRTCLRGCTETVSIPAVGGGLITYTVTFVVNGEIVSTQTVNHGNDATAPENIGKQPDEKNHYSLVWDKDFTNITADLTVTAQFVPSAHVYGEWVTDVPATCRNVGSQHRDCACGHRVTAEIARLEHDYSVIKSTNEPTCTSNGNVVKACKSCGNETTEVLSRLGHSLTYHQGIEATCTTEGLKAHYSCSRCGKLFTDKYCQVEIKSPVIGMNYHTLVVIKGTEPTCLEAGSTDFVRCTVCGYKEESRPLPALGHTDVNNDKCCDRCDSAYLEGGQIICTCNCHKPGIINEIIYKIICFFWKLFGNRKSCECGVLHY